MDISFTIPSTATLKQKVGNSVKIGDILYSFSSSEDVSISVTQELGVKPQEIFKYIELTVGQSIQAGAVVASRKGMIGRKKVSSPTSGVIKHIDYMSGQLIVTVISQEETGDVPAFFSGTIKSYDDASQVLTVTIPKAIEIKLKEVSGNGGGEYYYYKDQSAYFNISEDDVKDKIILIEELAPHIETKLEALSCLGFVLVKGAPSEGPETPWAQLPDQASFKSLVESKNTHVVFSSKDKKALAYSI